MFDFNKKKISLSIFLITLALISFISKVKTKVEIPTAFDVYLGPTEWEEIIAINLFGGIYSYNDTLFVLMLIIMMSILLFIFSDDTQISEKTKSFKQKVLKWDIKLIAISILVFILVLIIGKSCSNNSKSVNSKAMQDSLTVTEEFAMDCVAVAPVEVAYPLETSDDELIRDQISNTKNKNSKGMSRFGQAVKEVEGMDEGVASGFSSGQGLSFEELRSQDASQNNISVELLSKYKSQGEKDK